MGDSVSHTARFRDRQAMADTADGIRIARGLSDKGRKLKVE